MSNRSQSETTWEVLHRWIPGWFSWGLINDGSNVYLCIWAIQIPGSATHCLLIYLMQLKTQWKDISFVAKLVALKSNHRQSSFLVCDLRRCTWLREEIEVGLVALERRYWLVRTYLKLLKNFYIWGCMWHVKMACSTERRIAAAIRTFYELLNNIRSRNFAL